MVKTCILLSAFLLIAVPSLNAQVVLSEIMYDAADNEFHDEFIEIVNLSATEPVDLQGWQIGDSDDLDEIIAVADSLILQPGQFAVILDASYFDNSTAYDTSIPPDALILTIEDNTIGSSGLSNSTAETVSLRDSTGEIISEYTYSLGNPPGHSDEKIVLSGPDTPKNWADSRTVLGTPGARNSVSPNDDDLAVFSGDISFSPATPQAEEIIEMSVEVHNLGLQPAGDFGVQFFRDADLDSMAEAGEELGPAVQFNGTLVSGDSVRISQNFSIASSGAHLIMVRIEFSDDDDLSNNLAIKPLRVSFPERSVRINEIMYAPLTDRAEWFEILNTSSQEIDLSQWYLSDSNTVDSVRIETDIAVPPNAHFVFAEDLTLLEQFESPPGSFAVVKGFPSLANAFDSVVIYDLTGRIIDRVDYDQSWGGDRGFSLEKINPNLSSNDETNWTTSVAASGGTPGEQNSVFAEVIPAKTTLSVAPNPFSPDGDGRDDFAVITYELPLTTAAVNIKIYDIRGRLIRFLANNMASGARNTLVWDGKDDSGEVARIGIYVIFLQALNAEAGVIKTQKQSLVLARQL